MTGDVVGGVWTFTVELAAALGKHGIEVFLAAMGGAPSEWQRAEAQRVPNLTLVPGDFKLEWMDDPWSDVARSGEWLLELEGRFRPDLIHLNTYGHGALPWRRPVVLTAHSCVASWWRAVKGEPLPQSWERYRQTVARSLRAADVLTAPTQAMLDTIQENYNTGFTRRRLVAPNGRRADRFRALRKEPFILSAGRLWDEGKNAATLAAIAPRLRWPVCLAGEIRQPGVEDAAGGADVPWPTAGVTAAHWPGGPPHLLGKLGPNELTCWYGRASIYALPARYEPFGLSALEAALSGCALVLGDIASLREVWGDAAIYAPPDDRAGLTEALNELIANPQLCERMARRASERAREFTPERMADAYIEAYRLAASRSVACVS